MSCRDFLPCGCYWTREAGPIVYGDVLKQCEAHAAGAPYAGAEPLTDEEMADLLGVLRGEGLKIFRASFRR